MVETIRKYGRKCFAFSEVISCAEGGQEDFRGEALLSITPPGFSMHVLRRAWVASEIIDESIISSKRREVHGMIRSKWLPQHPLELTVKPVTLSD